MFAALTHTQSDSGAALGSIADDGCCQAGFSGGDAPEILSRECTARRDDMRLEPRGRRGGVSRTSHGQTLFGGAVGLPWAQTRGGACAGGGRGRAPPGRGARAARPDVSHDPRVYAPHGPGRFRSPADARCLRGPLALTPPHGGGVKPAGLSLTQNDQSQAAEKAQGHRGSF